MLGRLFLDHPRSVHESYLTHCRAALGFALLLIGGGLAAAIHALVPCLFQKTASRAVARLYDRMIVNRIVIKGAAGQSPQSDGDRGRSLTYPRTSV